MSNGSNLCKVISLSIILAFVVVLVSSFSVEEQYIKNTEIIKTSKQKPIKDSNKNKKSKLINVCNIGDYVNYESRSCTKWRVFNKNTATGEVILIADTVLFDIRPHELGFELEQMYDFANLLKEKRTSAVIFPIAYDYIITEENLKQPSNGNPELSETTEYTIVEKNLVYNKELDVYNSNYASSYSFAPNYTQIEKALETGFLSSHPKGLAERNSFSDLTYWPESEISNYDCSNSLVLIDTFGYWIAEYTGIDKTGTYNVAAQFDRYICEASCRSYAGLRPIVYLKPGLNASGSSNTGWNLVK